MADDYTLHVGGYGSGAELVIDDVVEASVNITENGMSDFSATIPKTTEVRQYLQDDIYVVDETVSGSGGAGEKIWYGVLEEWEESEIGVETVIAGRGPLVQDNNTSIEQTYNSTFADDALEDFTSNSAVSFEFITEDRDTRAAQEPPAADGSGTSGTIENQLSTTDGDYVDWNVAVRYSQEVSSSTVGVSDTSGGADETTAITEDQTEFIHSNLTAASATNSPYVYVDVDSYSIEKIAVFPSASSQRYIIEEEAQGSVLEGLQSLSEIAGYRFSSQNYDATTNTHILFPIGHVVEEPDWRILDSNRASDFAGYANEVIVRGAEQDDGTYPSATESDADEISAVGKTISRYIKRVDLETEAECRSVAKTILSSSIENRGESGSITTTIPDAEADVVVGANTNIAVWAEAFEPGGITGSDAIAYEKNGVRTPYIEGEDFAHSSPVGDGFVVEFNVWPRLDDMDEPARLISTDHHPNVLVLNSDGSLETTRGNTSTTFSSTEGAVSNRSTQTIRFEHKTTDEVVVEVDGNAVIQDTFNSGWDIAPTVFRIGNKIRNRARNFEVYEDTSLNVSWDEHSLSGSVFSNHCESNLVGDVSENDANAWEFVDTEDAAYREAVTNTGNTPAFTTAHDTELNIEDDVLSIATWFYVDSSTDGEGYLIEKGARTNIDEGWAINVNDGQPELHISTGGGLEAVDLAFNTAQNQTRSIARDEWHHLVVNIDNTDSSVESFIDGERLFNETVNILGTSIDNTDEVVYLDTDDDITMRLDETRVYDGRLLLQDAVDTLSSKGPYYDENLVGGVDEIKYFSGDDTSNEYTHWRLDDDSTPNTAVDSVADRDGVINALEYAATRAPIKELSYNFTNDAQVDAKFDISNRVDTELANVRGSVEDIKN